MAKILRDSDADLKYLKDRLVALIGYGSQGSAQALCLRDSGVEVIIGQRQSARPDSGWTRARRDGFEVTPVTEAAAQAGIIHLLVPDEIHGEVYRKDIEPHMTAGKALSFSHGFSIVYKQIVPPPNVDVIMVAPKSPATEQRKAYLAGFGVPALVAVCQNPSGKAHETALAMAKAMGFTRAGVIECSFREETYEDLFGEQNVLCGGCVDLIKSGFEVLVEAGYPPEVAYFECLHELKLIVDLIHQGGIGKMNSIISNTAEWGEYVNGPKIIDESVKERMKASLRAIEDGSFARSWIEESQNGCPSLLKKRQELQNHPIEVAGRRIRALFEKKDQLG
jgi:ketol-acid reductoisomerase